MGVEDGGQVAEGDAGSPGPEGDGLAGDGVYGVGQMFEVEEVGCGAFAAEAVVAGDDAGA